MANITAKTSSNVFYQARCNAATHNEQLSSREGAADYDLDKIADVLGVQFNREFILANGEKV